MCIYFSTSVHVLSSLQCSASHRVHRFEAWLLDHLTNFRMRQEGLISHLPKALRTMTLRDFAKYDGDIQKAVQGLQAESYGQVEGIDRTTRKRKWIESQEQEAELLGSKAGLPEEGAKPFKTGAQIVCSAECALYEHICYSYSSNDCCHAKESRGAIVCSSRAPAQHDEDPFTCVYQTSLVSGLWSYHFHQLRNQRIITVPTPSPHKPIAPKPLPLAFPTSRPTSPTKPKLPFGSPTKARPPAASTSQFNPSIPAASSSTYPRWPRKDESMLSVNGSPLANPFTLDLTGWLSRHRETDDDEPESLRGKGTGTGALDRKRSANIMVRSVSSSSQPGAGHGSHSRQNSNSNSTSNGKNPGFVPVRGNALKVPESLDPATPSLAALVSVPTADGHLLEFDPFQTSPAEIDALEGISSSAKKKAKEDMRTLVRQAVERWRIE